MVRGCGGGGGGEDTQSTSMAVRTTMAMATFIWGKLIYVFLCNDFAIRFTASLGPFFLPVLLASG